MSAKTTGGRSTEAMMIAVSVWFGTNTPKLDHQWRHAPGEGQGSGSQIGRFEAI